MLSNQARDREKDVVTIRPCKFLILRAGNVLGRATATIELIPRIAACIQSEHRIHDLTQVQLGVIEH